MTGALTPYPEFKDTGLPWCPQIPAHWKLKPNRAFLRQRKVLVGERHPEYTLLSLTKRGVIVRDITENKGKFSADMGTSQEVRPGDLVMCLFDVPETPRTVGLSGHHGMITSAYTVFEVSNPTVAEWLEAFYIAMDDRKLLSPLYSGLRNTIPRPAFLGTKTPIPPPDEQRDIVRFVRGLDKKANRFIRNRRRLIEALDEQKKASIDQAVMGGLNENVLRKLSGLPWCPQIPAHWKLKPNRAFLRQRKVLVGERHPEYTLLSLTKRGVIVRDITENKGKFSADMGTSQEVRPGDLVMCLFDVPETPRTVGLSGHHGMITSAYTVFEVSNPTVAEWLEAFYIAMDDRKLLSPLYSGLRNTIPRPAFLGTKTPIPPPDEQRDIVVRVRRETAALTAWIDRSQCEIDLIREYRTRLIADVITGKLDVRGLHAPETGVAETKPEDLDVDVDTEMPEEADEGKAALEAVNE